MDKYYPFDISSKRMLMRMTIRTFERHGDAFFQIHEMSDCSVKVFWRKGLRGRIPFEAIIKIEEQYFNGSILPIDDLILTDEYKNGMAILSPFYEISFSDEELRKIIELCNNGIPVDYEEIYGLDGNSYDICFENNKRHSLWCIVHESLRPVADVINLLVSRAGLDEDMYSIKIKK